jgi:hypothetical protein
VGFLWFKFLRAAALLFGVSVRAVLLALFEALLSVALRDSLVRPPVGRSAAPLRRAEVVALASARFACGRAAEAPGLRDLDLALARAPAPAFDFFELFLRDAIRTSLLPRSAQQAEHATGECDTQHRLTTVSDRQSPAFQRLVRSQVRAAAQSRPIRNRASKKAPEFGAQWQSTGEAVRSES